METYNLGKIEIIRDLLTPITEGFEKVFKISRTDSKNREYAEVRNEFFYIEKAVEIMKDLGFRLPNVEEVKYISDIFEHVAKRNLPYYRYWIDRGNGPEIVYFHEGPLGPYILDIDDYGNNSWSHTLFAVKDK